MVQTILSKDTDCKGTVCSLVGVGGMQGTKSMPEERIYVRENVAFQARRWAAESNEFYVQKRRQDREEECEWRRPFSDTMKLNIETALSTRQRGMAGGVS